MFVKNGDNSFNVKSIVTEKQGKVTMTCPICMASYAEGTVHTCTPKPTPEEPNK